MIRPAWWKCTVFGVTALVTTLLDGSAPASSPTTIGIKDFKYAPPMLTVTAGTTVRWVNQDEETHTVTSTTSAFGSTGLSHDDTFEQTFRKAGSYTYFCALHPHMRATVVVK